MEELNSISRTAGATYAYSRQYVENEVELLKLNAIERSSVALGHLIYRLFLATTFLLAIVFLSITIAFGISTATGSFVLGFGSIACLYLLFSGCAYLFRNFLQRKFADSMVVILDQKLDEESKL